jgi:isopentenyldiphosphate isomerase
MENFFYLTVDGIDEPLAYVHKTWVEQMTWSSDWKIDEMTRTLTLSAGSSPVDRSTAMQKTLQHAEAEQRIQSAKKWGEALLPVVTHSGQHVLDMDICGMEIFGIVCAGVHLIAYTMTDDGPKYWIPRRGEAKLPFPSKLDNTVSSNLLTGEQPMAKLIAKAEIEASLPAPFMLENTKACGTVTYAMEANNGKGPVCQHHVQYVYEVELPESIVPKPTNDEVQTFELMTAAEVGDCLMDGKFADWRAMTWVDHFVRHGIINAENEDSLIEVCARLHRRLQLFRV